MTAHEKNIIVEQLQKEVLSMQGFKKAHDDATVLGMAAIERSFPNKVFPTSALHEFVSSNAETAAATNGFVAGILGRIVKNNGTCLWISDKRTVFPPALKKYGIDPDRVIFIDLQSTKDVLWSVEEALKCVSLSAVVGELRNLSFTESRRLQLAVEHSNVTGFIHRYSNYSNNVVACVSRWSIKPIPSIAVDGMPGVGVPRWHVQLQKVRNGKPGAWDVEWTSEGFKILTTQLLPFVAGHKNKTA